MFDGWETTSLPRAICHRFGCWGVLATGFGYTNSRFLCELWLLQTLWSLSFLLARSSSVQWGKTEHEPSTCMCPAGPMQSPINIYELNHPARIDPASQPYIDAYKNPYIAYINSFIHSCMHTYMRRSYTYIIACIHTHTSAPTYTRTYIHSHTHKHKSN